MAIGVTVDPSEEDQSDWGEDSPRWPFLATHFLETYSGHVFYVSFYEAASLTESGASWSKGMDQPDEEWINFVKKQFIPLPSGSKVTLTAK